MVNITITKAFRGLLMHDSDQGKMPTAYNYRGIVGDGKIRINSFRIVMFCNSKLTLCRRSQTSLHFLVYISMTKASCRLLMLGGDQWNMSTAYKCHRIIEEGGEIRIYGFEMEVVIVVTGG